jgi:DNA-binding transcriptional LysR family regulator
MIIVSSLPSVSLIAAFEAAARHLNFTRAATELNVQQPAISRQIAALEAEVGTQLFLRTKPALTLTPEGEALFASVSKGFDEVRRGFDQLRDRRRANVLVVNAAIGFTSLFLMPRLGAFQAAFPDIELEIVTRDQNTGFDPRASDLVVVFDREGLTGTTARKVLEGEIYAVCAPSVMGDREAFSLEELTRQRLLHLRGSGHDEDWPIFFAGTGLTPPVPNRVDRIFSFMVYLHAVENGTGVGLGWTHMTDGLIESGRLRIAADRRVRTGRAYHCCLMDHARQRAEARTFLDWISSLVPSRPGDPSFRDNPS